MDRAATSRLAPHQVGRQADPGSSGPAGRAAWLAQLQHDYDSRAQEVTDEAARAAAEAARKATLIINQKILKDERHHLDRVLLCLGTLHRLLSEANLHRHDPGRFHEVRASSKTLTRHVLDMPGGENLLLTARWLPVTHHHEKYFRFDSAADHSFEILTAVDGCVSKALKLAQAKQARRQAEEEERKTHKQYLSDIRKCIEADKEARKAKFNYNSVC